MLSKCYFYLKIGKESDFGALRSHEMLVPHPFSTTSEKKIRKTPVSGTVQGPQCIGKHPWFASAPSSTWWSTAGAKLPSLRGAEGSRVEQGQVSPMAVGVEWYREGWPLPCGPLGSFKVSLCFKDMPCVRWLLVTVDSDKIVQIVPICEGILPHS